MTQARLVHVLGEACADIQVPELRKGTAHVPTIFWQERIPQQQILEQVVNVPWPMLQERVDETSHIFSRRPMLKHILEVPVLVMQEVFVPVPEIIQSEFVGQPHVELIVEVLICMPRESIVHVPTLTKSTCRRLVLVLACARIRVPYQREQTMEKRSQEQPAAASAAQAQRFPPRAHLGAARPAGGSARPGFKMPSQAIEAAGGGHQRCAGGDVAASLAKEAIVQPGARVGAASSQGDSAR